MLFPRSFTGTQTKVNIRLFSSTEYLEYQQKIKNVFHYENKVFCYPFTRFFFKQMERVIPRRSCYFLFKKNQNWKGRTGDPKRRKCSAYLERIKERTYILSSLVFNLRVPFVKQNYWREWRSYYKGFRDTHWKDKKKNFFVRLGDNFFLHPLARKTEALFFLAVDKISKLCSTSESSERSPVSNLEPPQSKFFTF